jgi:hypothetical protein
MIGLYELVPSGGLPCFGIIMTCATFHWAGNHPVLRTELHMDARWTRPLLGSYFNILPVIRSYLGAFFGLRSSFIKFWISLGVKNLFGCIVCSGSSSALLISVSKASFCGSSFGLNACFKCPTKCSLYLYHFGPRTGPFSWLVACVVSVVLIVWLFSRVKSRCQLSFLSFKGMSELFLLWFFLLWSFNSLVASLYRCLSSGCRLICHLLSFCVFLELVLDFQWVFRIFSLRFVVCCCAQSRLLCLVIYVIASPVSSTGLRWDV